MKEIFLKMMVNTYKVYITFTMIYDFQIEKVEEKFITNLLDKTEYVIHIKKLRQALNY